MSNPDAPIGVFDSGVGGLSLLPALRERLPAERFIYFADSAYAPYGERDADYVVQRALAIGQTLIAGHGCKLVVVACNTATAAAIEALRARWPQLPFVGVEPALKPAAALTRTGRVGVLATAGTLQSTRFAALAAAQPQATFVPQACDGLAEAIERDDTAAIARLAARYVDALGPTGDAPGQIDTVVLGCTHYPLVSEVLARLLPGIALVHPGPAVARQCERVLQERGLLRTPEAVGGLTWLSSGSVEALQAAGHRWLGAD